VGTRGAYPSEEGVLFAFGQREDIHFGYDFESWRSIWHRWDPRICAPGTLLSDHFNGCWEGYLTAIEESDPLTRA
jgi:hypothetical protein